MSRKKKKNKKLAAYKQKQAYYDSLWLPANSKDIKEIAFKVFGSTYFTVDQNT
jgi:hypothetical protein